MNDKMYFSDAIGLGLPSKRLIDSIYNLSTKMLILLCFMVIALLAVGNFESFSELIEWLKVNRIGRLYVYVGKALFIVNLLVLFWRIALVIRYRPIKPCRDEELPVCTVIIPAYNEGQMVLKTIHTVAMSDYPADKLQIIAVDDGSKDDTWHWMEQAAIRENVSIQTIRMPQNGGKRKALYEGFVISKGEVIVTIDSDSIIEPQTLRCIVSPFCVDEKVGAVAGSVKVLNKHKGLIPRMLDVSFAYSFEFLRASQSMVNTVFCTPGALSAYRRGPLMDSLDSWMKQTFMGREAKIGEDRAMTNAILSRGYHVKFQSNAVVHTDVPVKYSKLCNMFLRWARSNIRETIVMSKFIFTDFRNTSAVGARINFLLGALALTIPQIMLIGLLCCVLWHPSVFVLQSLFCASLSGLIPAAFYFLRRFSTDAIWAIPYSIFWLFGLSWISIYAICTAGNDKWLTREIKDKNPVVETVRPA